MTMWPDIADQAAFDRTVLASPRPVIVAFETGDCQHCREHRLLLSLAWQRLGWTATTARVDATRLPTLAHRYRVVGYPKLTVFAGGKLLQRFAGRRNPTTLTRQLAALLSDTDRPGDRPPPRRWPFTTRIGQQLARTPGQQTLHQSIRPPARRDSVTSRAVSAVGSGAASPEERTLLDRP